MKIVTIGYPFRRLLTILVLVGCFGCSSQKNSLVNRTYHNLLTHYNIYWNGEEAYKEGEAQLNTNIKDDYNQILPVYLTGNQQNIQSVNSLMNRAIEKANKAISRHSLIYNYKEYNRWMDDCYLLIGKASYIKQDWGNAHRNFDYVMAHFKGEPTYYESMLWQAKTCIKDEEYERAASYLAQLQNLTSREKVPLTVIQEIPLTYAWLFQKDQNEGLAIKYLNDALKSYKKKSQRSRILFILGQYYLREDNFALATQSFEKVLKSNPSFEMAFQARINLAESFDPTKGNTKSLEKSLQKMLREEKNKEYASQLYYALGSLSLKDKNDSLAVSRFKLSVSTAGNNRSQKAFAALRLGELYFERQMYVKSQIYYDTAVQFLPEDHPEFAKASQRAVTLTKLAKEIQIVAVQDSLQRIARMPESTRKEFINNLIENVLKNEDLAREAEAKAKANTALGYNVNNRITQGISGEWYFYNPSALSYGYTEFVKRWGRRALEDNWRLSNKRIVAEFSKPVPKDTTKGAKSAAENVSIESTDPHKPETYLKNLPLTKEKLKASDSLICNALYSTGLLYREGLSDNLKAAAALEQMITRFPDQPNGAVPYYLLYRIFTDQNDLTKAKRYSDLLIEKYPESQYAHIVSDPAYFTTLAQNKDKALKLYDETLDAIKKSQFQLVNIYSKEALKNLPLEDPLRPRFEFTLALSLIKTAGRDTARLALQKIAVKYANDPVSAQALNVIRSMDELPADMFMEKSYLQEDIYRFMMEQPHSYAILADSSKLNIIALKARMGDLLLRQYRSSGLTINTAVFANMTLFTVSGFPNGAKALPFYDAVITETYIQSILKGVSSYQFIISDENLTALKNNRNPDSYLKFFHLKYKR
ncbi:MAG: tetratricopeptide repeat protein [Bacteroidota bacterium]|nr:tetratricopeptide repeat protein [Bacteroidota bacterium]